MEVDIFEDSRIDLKNICLLVDNIGQVKEKLK